MKHGYCLVLLAACLSSAFADEFPQGWEEEGGISTEEKSSVEEEKLQVGGNFLSEFYYYKRELGAGDSYFVNPNTLWVYLDSRLRDDVRAFMKGRVYHDPTANPALTSPLTGLPGVRDEARLDEAKLQFSIRNSVFLTVGKQKIKWGSGKFWNPTDFINTLRRDIFFAEDRRSGVALLKAHVPVGASNFYYLTVLEDADRLQELGHAVRAEVPFSASEIAFSAVSKSGRKPVFGADISSALWELDLYAEGAFSGGSNTILYGPTGPLPADDRVVTNVSTGLSYDWKYSDADLVMFGFEYFFNDEGYRSTAEYPWVLQNGAYQPYLLGRNYGMLSVYLPKPGNWNDLTFQLLNLGNLSDGSATMRLIVTVTSFRDLTIDLGGGYHYGNPSGELRFAGQKWDGFLRMQVNL